MNTMKWAVRNEWSGDLVYSFASFQEANEFATWLRARSGLDIYSEVLI